MQKTEISDLVTPLPRKRQRTEKVSPNFNSQNQFEVLSDDDDGQHIITKQQQSTASTAQQKPPPINVLGTSISQLDQFLKQNNVANYEMKLTTEGIRLFTKTIDSFKHVKDQLKTKEIHFYTHQLREERMTKFVLHGLHNMAEAEVLAEINKSGVNPSLIKKMKIKRARYDGHAVYLVYFMKTKNVRLAELIEKCKVISYIRVKWELYRNPEKGPTQCRNCLRYGHGGNNCAAASRCVRCAGLHASNKCPLIINDSGTQIKTRIDDSLLKCALCSLNHAASSRLCPKRKVFVESKMPHQNKPKRINTERKTFMPAPELNDFHFPRLAHNSKQIPNLEPTRRPTRPTNQSVESNPQDTSLFSRNELLSIFIEMTNQLAQAKSKTQQVQILMDIALKHCTNE
jgi:hypothetical protein